MTAILSTIADYSVMLTAVELVGIGPVAATPIAAFAGGVTNFTVNRRFTYRAQSVPVQSQLWRYALVSSCSLALNTMGEYLFLKIPHLHYFLARVIVSTIISNVWNYPLLRFFVFNQNGGTTRRRSG